MVEGNEKSLQDKCTDSQDLIFFPEAGGVDIYKKAYEREDALLMKNGNPRGVLRYISDGEVRMRPNLYT